MTKLSMSNWNGRYRRLSFWWVVGFGSGLIKPAPGTWGSLFGLIAGLGLLTLSYPALTLIAGAFIITLISSFVIDAIESQTGVHDAPEIVIDEVAGQWLALVPLAFFGVTSLGLIAAFVFFRVFDIWKPWPIGALDEKVSGGFGVMVDDLVAGLFAAIIVFGLMFFDML